MPGVCICRVIGLWRVCRVAEYCIITYNRIFTPTVYIYPLFTVGIQKGATYKLHTQTVYMVCSVYI